ncbi:MULTISPECIES: bifunctional diaminohydroxyphosphoribosylaminopyrimidine deaminase/5-amino-6-(5-phosphoribosylamino)uracil reductase RibD [Brachymonas]|uniref:bifunctional diaminohydroxyphosphoribosylaminopyrimidine deaminase/5-amino-6-(5-phosphoribosylamino)uracil reductase RibD n=1 Tax=Brachymonas TaxID=28219 RepID=UPI002E78C0B4|nr:bifunctional diaminohydroxyphosphoribosylaminopyrimidine deaminase/5-amino-6-(5-phosphoribosylamino)uracil reductase RibD [Brachymonas sp. J145]MEE1653378.1 bifunctional diaminohydroxyphosphoribosylaminopyrimidine deaminase/5-amino-6-(5-phosphoribosylamino)uracil reductase RibD [Brachymonas sp. J145]
MDYFSLALDLAANALTLSNPNPRVGAVIVSPDGRIQGQGYTQQRGGPHAEVMALRDAASRGEDVRGSTCYVTLEPCSHQGRTPPCCDALIVAGVGKVCIALLDPNPLVAGQGMARLQAAGIAVELAPDEITARARELNIGFLRRMQQGLPWVRLKTASSLDGRVALDNGDSQWITGKAARAEVQHWRARACAVLTGIGTVLADDPLLNVRLPEATRQPHLVIVDTQLRTPLSAQLLQVAQRRVLIASVAQADTGWQQRAVALQQAGAELLQLPADPAGRPDLVALLRELGRQEVNELHVESGAQLAGALLQQGLVNELVAYVAPVLLGPGQPLAVLPPLERVADAARWQLQALQAVGDDVRLQLRPA